MEVEEEALVMGCKLSDDADQSPDCSLCVQVVDAARLASGGASRLPGLMSLTTSLQLCLRHSCRSKYFGILCITHTTEKPAQELSGSSLRTSNKSEMKLQCKWRHFNIQGEWNEIMLMQHVMQPKREDN